MNCFVRGVGAMSLFVVGCHAPPSQLPAGQVLRYGVSHMSGNVSVTVASDGSAVVVRSVGVEETRHAGNLSDNELAEIAEKMRANSCCSLSSGRDTGVPDEAHPSFAIRMGDLDCKVGMWDNEIRDDEDSQTCFNLMDDVANRIAPPKPLPN